MILILLSLSIVIKEHLTKESVKDTNLVCIHRFADIVNKDKNTAHFGLYQLTLSSTENDTTRISNFNLTFLRINVDPNNFYEHFKVTDRNIDEMFDRLKNNDNSDISLQYNLPQKAQMFQALTKQSKNSIFLSNHDIKLHKIYIAIPNVLDGLNKDLVNILELSIDLNKQSKKRGDSEWTSKWTSKTYLKGQANGVYSENKCVEMSNSQLQRINTKIDEVTSERISKEKLFNDCGKDIEYLDQNRLYLFPIYEDMLTKSRIKNIKDEFKTVEYGDIMFVSDLYYESEVDEKEDEDNHDNNDENEDDEDDNEHSVEVKDKKNRKDKRNTKNRKPKTNNVMIAFWVCGALVGVMLIMILTFMGIRYNKKTINEKGRYDTAE